MDTSLQATGESSSRTDEIAEHIRAYLAVNPHAADTVEGIQKWWLSSARSNTTVVDVECALAELLLQGELVCRTLADGTKIFSRRNDSSHSSRAV